MNDQEQLEEARGAMYKRRTPETVAGTCVCSGRPVGRKAPTA